MRLGPFQIDEPLGQGGMGQVWRDVHIEQQVPVALKVITTDRAREPSYRSAFRNEVRAIAGLDHPDIVLVLDHGEVPADLAVASGGQLVEGSPYLVMELASRGTLAPWCRSGPSMLGWPDLKGILLALLEALAHAHARGIIHRDLSPSSP